MLLLLLLLLLLPLLSLINGSAALIVAFEKLRGAFTIIV